MEFVSVFMIFISLFLNVICPVTARGRVKKIFSSKKQQIFLSKGDAVQNYRNFKKEMISDMGITAENTSITCGSFMLVQ
ncbi:hypothetical protein GV64_04770 [Endozoicomonas elysicola]|uniref:Uncharacterized protein n=1 Tax=Endozoicomonas elysicola TaxID=305900 RepID=A0A081K7M2_9GAMM|nr:hypothetical protein GV64_04770 [Endozoicomonas elysicola]